MINRAVVSGILEKRGHSLVHAATGCEAVEAAARESFDLIFMDVQMPDMDGFEATRRIREFEQTFSRHTPIAAMTAHAMEGDRERCLAAGMDDYISKPLQKSELLELLERNCAKRMFPIFPEVFAETAEKLIVTPTTAPLVISKSIGVAFTTSPPVLSPKSPRVPNEVPFI
jgi:CheY-like chemotaxis protein